MRTNRAVLPRHRTATTEPTWPISAAACAARPPQARLAAASSHSTVGFSPVLSTAALGAISGADAP
eukprot:7359627-Alexandrium_andersonii.AAC.1